MLKRFKSKTLEKDQDLMDKISFLKIMKWLKNKLYVYQKQNNNH